MSAPQPPGRNWIERHDGTRVEVAPKPYTLAVQAELAQEKQELQRKVAKTRAEKVEGGKKRGAEKTQDTLARRRAIQAFASKKKIDLPNFKSLPGSKKKDFLAQIDTYLASRSSTVTIRVIRRDIASFAARRKN